MAFKNLVWIGLVLLALLAWGCGQRKPLTPEAAHERLERLGLEFNQHAFVRTAAGGNLERINLYLDAGIDPNGEDDGGTTALYAAASSRSDEAIRLLVARGSDSKRRSFRNESVPERVGFTPLGIATVSASLSTVKTLLECGADPNEFDGVGNPPAWWAILPKASEMKLYTDCLRALLEGGSDVNARGRDGDTLLIHGAAVSGSETVALLIEKGADVHAIDKEGNTARQRAEKAGNSEVVALLAKAGG
jgi:ankyrin repeat protein